jgi:dihydrodipicolinate synthase/N-acetylneuraminate lyase
VGLKDCCVDQNQSFDLLRARPSGFAVFTGEDALFYGALMQGADGGILAAAHVETEAFAQVRNTLLAGDSPRRSRAGARWSISHGCCSPSRARRRSSTGCGAAA